MYFGAKFDGSYREARFVFLQIILQNAWHIQRERTWEAINSDIH
jgi:hypothetical protein